MLIYNENVYHYDCLILFTFEDDKLIRGSYIFDPKFTDTNDYIHTYNQMKSRISEKYGKPIKEDVYWIDSLYIDNNQKWGYAVHQGHVSFCSIWETIRTRIDLGLIGIDGNILLDIVYWDKNHKPIDEF